MNPKNKNNLLGGGSADELVIAVQKPYCIKNLQALGEEITIKKLESVPVRIVRKNDKKKDDKYCLNIPIKILNKKEHIETLQENTETIELPVLPNQSEILQNDTEFLEKLEKLVKLRQERLNKRIKKTKKVREKTNEEKRDFTPFVPKNTKKTGQINKSSIHLSPKKDFQPTMQEPKTPPAPQIPINEKLLLAQSNLDIELNKNLINNPNHQLSIPNKENRPLLKPEDLEKLKPKEGKVKKSRKKKIKTKKNKRQLMRIATACLMAFVLPVIIYWGVNPSLPNEFFGYKIRIESADKGILGVSEESVFENRQEEEEYEVWSKKNIQQKTGTEENKGMEGLEPESDEDEDGLTNLEEFRLETNPHTKYTCDEDKEKTDAQNLYSLINPSTCQVIDFEDEEELIKFSKFINLPESQEGMLKIDNEKVETINTDSLYSVFGVSDLEKIELHKEEEIKQDITIAQKQQEYLKTIQRIDSYITKYRSYDPHDRNYDVPVSPSIFLEVSLKYDTPLKYVLAIARLESRFGTDRFTHEGVATRIYNHNNIYSMGLDDAGNNWTFDTWEGSVESFGIWYKKFEDRGVSDCTKWRIYNPNGDYCAKVEKTAAEIEDYIYRDW